MNPKLFACFFLALAFSSRAQERIDTDRPDQTESPYTVPKKYFQGEFGFGKENIRGRDYNLTHPAFLLKYGVFKRMELRLEGNYLSENIQMVPERKTFTSLEPLEVGMKIGLLEEKGWRPKTSLITHLGLPFAGSNYDRDQNLFPSFRFACQNSLSSTMGLGYNFGAQWDGYDARPTWLYTFSPNINIGKRWYAYVEAFGFLPAASRWEHNLDGGLAYYISKDTKIDLSGGFGLGQYNPLKNYFALGFSFRVPARSEK